MRYDGPKKRGLEEKVCTSLILLSVRFVFWKYFLLIKMHGVTRIEPQYHRSIPFLFLVITLNGQSIMFACTCELDTAIVVLCSLC